MSEITYFNKNCHPVGGVDAKGNVWPQHRPENWAQEKKKFNDQVDLLMKPLMEKLMEERNEQFTSLAE